MAKSKGQKRRREAEAAQDQQNAVSDDQTDHPSKRTRTEKSRSLFVRSLPAAATQETLTEFFSQHYPVKHAMVVTDKATKQSRGYGFVTFTDADDALEAKAKLDNALLDGRRLKLDIAEPRQRASGAAGPVEVRSRLSEEKQKREADLAEARKPAKLIIRNLPWSIKSSEQLTKLFQSYGKVRFADLPQSKGKLSGFGFITMRGRKNAEKALEGINGKQVDGRTLAVDWAVAKEEWQQHQGDSQKDEEWEDVADEEADGDLPKKKRTEAKTPKKSPDEDDEDADLENFMRNHMENLEDEEDSENEDKENEDSEAAGDTPKAEKPKRLTDNSTTAFIRNLPFTATDETLKAHFTQFGAIRYARVVMDRATEKPAGTGFVCFVKDEDFKACLKGAPRHQSVMTKSKKHSVLQNETVDQEGKYTIEGRVLQVAPAVSKEEATRLFEEGPGGKRNQDKDKRRIYLLSEGTISKGSPLYDLLSPNEVKLREDSAKQRRKLIQGNPSLHLSLTRLAIRNIPRNIDSKELKALAREAVVGFAKDVKEGKRQPLSKEEMNRAGQEDKEAEHRRKEKGKGVVRQAKIVFETKEGSKVAEETGAGRSRGYGFIEYSSHRWALMGLRWLNGHALKNEAGKTVRLVVEFAIENAQVVARRKAAEEKFRQRDSGAGQEGSKEQERGTSATSKNNRKGGKGRDAKSVTRSGEKTIETKDEGKSKDAVTKLAMRQRIIGRKRLTRKKKAQTRRGA
ncbi:putative nucleolar protein 4 protein [Phaeoacremonium minimum UCRPA7]|uniref:Putative nucleolar protein 4 protein n=1 Tax=Phaeoacremonium minimum (strain UCR-PA7) TaxID=1286976 RepID=R8BWG1_PHAM7|nr:putative nucleolar protein 4 protein [Phaeoacremonium minimum UCRPA7]EOO03670.1 putative nucleolar protein 4 protein [Phaeoacremonium minimum UCRPA7]